MLILDKLQQFVRGRVVAMGGRLVEHEVEGYRLHSFEIDGHGAGPALVLLHGLGGSANSFFPILSKLRSAWRKLYVPDLPGHGFSPLHPGQALLDGHGYQRIFAGYLDTAVREPAALVGHSLGGAIVLRTALDRPLTAAIGLLAPAGAPLDEAGLAQIRSAFDGTSRATALTFLERLRHRPLPGAWLIASDMREHLTSPAIRHVLDAVVAGERLEEGSLRALRMPMLLAWGASEKILPPDGLDYFRGVLPSHARIEVVQQCGHLPMMERPNQTVQLLAELAKAATAALGQVGTAA